MKLHELASRIPGARVIGDGEVEVARPRYDNRRVQPGDLFCALVGEKADGNDFALAAVEAGAAAVLTAREDLELPVPRLVVTDDRAGLALASIALFDDPTKRLTVVGVTGTNGKTTSTYVLQSILTAAGHRTGRIGTTGWAFEEHGEELVRTTPEAPDLLEILEAMADRGATHVVMEVTSIAMPMKRVEGFSWAAGLFTNLTQDHLDFHGTMENYFIAKKSFFDALGAEAVAVANADDPHGEKMLEGVGARRYTYTLGGQGDVLGDVTRWDEDGFTMKIHGRVDPFEVRAPYLGSFNAANVLGCIATALALGLSAEAIRQGVAAAPQVRGRMERIPLQSGAVAVVDYAHTPDALELALEALRPLTRERLIVVVGAGGDRDRSKRPRMGRAAATADVAIITSDNPRSEEPAAIVEEVAAGAEAAEVRKVVDRREAIREAVSMAREGDVVLVAGKGHETYQEVMGVRHHFDDREEVINVGKPRAC